MSRDQLKIIVKNYASELKRNNFDFSNIFVFGSFVKGQTNKYSDIDIAVVSDKLKKFENYSTLWIAGSQVDSRIEPHGFTVKDFADRANPMASEIRRTGVQVV
ncbi:MAG: hypothetical protein A2261_00985, partial [Candidatus Magasanikbacteria bacterium RIFOXYA2_FULL_44_8]